MLIWCNSNETAAGFGMTGEHELQSSATAKMKFPWKWHYFWKRLFWKCPRGERDFVSLRPVALGLGVERWAKCSLSKGSSIPVSFHKLLQRIWGHRRERMCHECRNTSTQRWVSGCLWLLWLSDTSVGTESRAALCSVVQAHPLLIIFFLLKFTVEKICKVF